MLSSSIIINDYRVNQRSNADMEVLCTGLEIVGTKLIYYS